MIKESDRVNLPDHLKHIPNKFLHKRHFNGKAKYFIDEMSILQCKEPFKRYAEKGVN